MFTGGGNGMLVFPFGALQLAFLRGAKERRRQVKGYQVMVISGGDGGRQGKSLERNKSWKTKLEELYKMARPWLTDWSVQKGPAAAGSFLRTKSLSGVTTDRHLGEKVLFFSFFYGGGIMLSFVVFSFLSLLCQLTKSFELVSRLFRVEQLSWLVGLIGPLQLKDQTDCKKKKAAVDVTLLSKYKPRPQRGEVYSNHLVKYNMLFLSEV